MLPTLTLSSPLSPSISTKQPSLLTTSSFNGLRFPNYTLSSSSSTIRVRSQPQTITMMAKREEELKEIRTKSNDEINDEILQIKAQLFMLRLAKSAREDFKSSEFGRMRKRIARMLTVKREREIEQGIGKRLSRKLDKEWKRSIVVKPLSLQKLQEGKEAAGETA